VKTTIEPAPRGQIIDGVSKRNQAFKQKTSPQSCSLSSIWRSERSLYQSAAAILREMPGGTLMGSRWVEVSILG